MGFSEHAEEVATVRYLRRKLNDTLQSEGHPKETVICEELPRNASIVTQATLRRVAAKLALWEESESTQRDAYQMTRPALPDFLRNAPKEEIKVDEKAPEAAAPKKAAPKRKVRTEQ